MRGRLHRASRWFSTPCGSNSERLGEKAKGQCSGNMRRQSAFLASRFMTLGAHARSCAVPLAVNWRRSSCFSVMHGNNESMDPFFLSVAHVEVSRSRLLQLASDLFM